MAPTPYSARAYQTAAVGTADRNHQVVLLFDAAVRFLHQAQEGMRAGDHHAQCEGITRAQRIFSTLSAALDRESTPELSHSLFSLYNWIYNNLTEASIQDNTELLGQVITVVSDLRDAWRQAEQNLRAEQQPAQAGRRLAA